MSRSKAAFIEKSYSINNSVVAVKSNISSVDEYGFERRECFDFTSYDEFMSEYLSILTKRSKKWEALFRSRDSVGRSRKVKRYIRKGIPLKYRGKVWMAVSGAEARRSAHPGYYAKLLSGPKNRDLLDTIKVDLPRTFPENIYFKGSDSEKLKSLSNVLIAYGMHNPNVGYCQGLNYIAGIMLLVIGTEESVFWLLTVLLEEILPGYHTHDMTGVLVDIYTLEQIIKEKKPLIWRHLEYNKVELSLVVTKWFICLFVEVLPIETVFRLWDCLFYEGNKILMRASVALILANEENLFMSHDFGEIIECFKNMTREKRALECHDFIQNVFEITGALPRAYINELREEGRRKVLKERQES